MINTIENEAMKASADKIESNLRQMLTASLDRGCLGDMARIGEALVYLDHLVGYITVLEINGGQP